MKVDIFTLCSFANSDRGKFNIIGAFQTIRAKQAPIVTPLCALAIRMRFEKVEEGTKRIRISFIDEDGKPVMPTIEVGVQIKIPEGGSTATVPWTVLIQQLKLPKFGEYSVDLAIDGRQEASTPLYVREIPATPPQQLPPIPPQIG